MTQQNQSVDKVLRLKSLIETTGVSRSSAYNKNNPTSKYFDSSFPRPIRLGSRSVDWLESEVNAWVAARAQSRTVTQ